MQSLLPAFKEDNNNKLSWCFDDAFYGGSCVLLGSDASISRLFDLNIDLQAETSLKVEFAFKIECKEPCMIIDDNITMHLVIRLDYVMSSDGGKEGIIDLGSNSNKFNNLTSGIFEVVNCKDNMSKDEFDGWHLKAFNVLIKKCMTLKALTAVNSGLPDFGDKMKLGEIFFFIQKKTSIRSVEFQRET